VHYCSGVLPCAGVFERLVPNTYVFSEVGLWASMWAQGMLRNGTGTQRASGCALLVCMVRGLVSCTRDAFDYCWVFRALAAAAAGGGTYVHRSAYRHVCVICTAVAAHAT
jgi:hypothetical protein